MTVKLKLSHVDCIVLGAGASGLAAAWSAAQTGARVLLVDRAERAGNKVRVAGGGKGNVTNKLMGPQWYVGDEPDFCKPVLKRYGTDSALAMLSRLRIPLEEREAGQLFCLCPASQLVDALIAECRALRVQFALHHEIDTVEDAGEAFHVVMQRQGERFACEGRSLVIALGGPAWPQIGASDLGLKLAQQWGHRLVPVRPVLAPFIMPEAWPLHGLAGISLPVRVSVEGADTRTFEQSLLFTHKGLSGPAALQASCFWRKGLPVVIDFLPGLAVRDLMHDPAHGKLRVARLLENYLPNRLVEQLVAQTIGTQKVAETGKKTREALNNAIHAHRAEPLRTEGLSKAEASAGGVDTREVAPETLESRLRKQLFFAGEVLDVTGLLGGYNLHWAWASGFIAGENASKATG